MTGQSAQTTNTSVFLMLAYNLTIQNLVARITWIMLTHDDTMLFLLCWNRNLQAAIGAYYDFESPNVNTPSMSFVEDVTIGEGESVPPDTPFTKTWRIQNTGAELVTTFTCFADTVQAASLNQMSVAASQFCCWNVYWLHSSSCITGAESWPPGVCLKYIGGDQFGHVNTVMVKSLDPQEISDVSVQMRSPTAPGMYQGQWRMCTATGLFYGGRKSPTNAVFFSDPSNQNHLQWSANW